jgi:hypothetical protein
MPDMMKHDLSGVLLGNFHVQLWEGTALSMTITKDRVLPDGSFDGTIRDTHWETKDGRRVDSAPLLLSLFILTADDVEIDEHPDRVVQRFKKISDEGAIAYWALAEALDLDRYRAGGQIDWRRVIDEHQFAFTMRDLKRQAQSASQHGLVRYVLNPIPHEMPPFLEAVR